MNCPRCGLSSMILVQPEGVCAVCLVREGKGSRPDVEMTTLTEKAFKYETNEMKVVIPASVSFEDRKVFEEAYVDFFYPLPQSVLSRRPRVTTGATDTIMRECKGNG